MHGGKNMQKAYAEIHMKNLSIVDTCVWRSSLTSEDHGEDGEDLLDIGDWRHVAKSDTGEYRKGKVE